MASVGVMCAGCFTTIDGLVYSAVGAGAMLEAGFDRCRALIDAVFAAERRVLVWERNAAFCEYMDLDPVVVLGPKPLPEAVAEPRWVFPPSPAGLATL